MLDNVRAGFSLSVLGLAWMSAIGYFMDVREAFILGTPTTVMAPHTAIIFALLGLAALLADPRRGPMILLASSTTTGSLIRRLLPFALILPSVFGYFKIMLDNYDIVPNNLGVALVATANTMTLVHAVIYNQLHGSISFSGGPGLKASMKVPLA